MPTLPDEPIAEGRIGLIYPWGDDKILKLARDWVPADWLAYEFKIASIVQATGLNIPQAYELLEFEGRPGIIYDRFSGPTMLDRIGRAPHKALSLGKTLGILQADMHKKTGAADLPDNVGRLREKIKSITEAADKHKSAALRSVESLPKANALLHGDFHPGNIMLTDDGPIIIDWTDATRGHPLSDVARTVMLVSIGGIPKHPIVRAFVTLFRWTFKQAYLSAYFARSPYKRKELNRWLYPVVFSRLSEGVESERPRSIRWLEKLIGDVPHS